MSKKPKEVDGVMIERQRLILDCRQVNLAFRAPPVTELGSLPAVGDLEVPTNKTLFVAGGDIKDCFYACRLPAVLRDSFGLSWGISVQEAIEVLGEHYDGRFDQFATTDILTPCMAVFSVGFSWSFYLIQAPRTSR